MRSITNLKDIAIVWRATLSDALKFSKPQFEDRIHLEAGVDWLLEAANMNGKKGFSKSYYLMRGWDGQYPETTGYIIPTLLNFIEFLPYRKHEIETTILCSAQWLLSLQGNDGSFPDGTLKKSMVFDTGQILFGLCELYKSTKENVYLRALTKAAFWLETIQEKGGSWKKYTYGSMPHTYHARVSWALLQAYLITHEKRFKRAAEKDLEWTVSQQQKNGWFAHSYLDESNISLLHTIAYVIQGLLESGVILGEEIYIKSAQRTADVLLSLNKKNILSAFYNDRWERMVRSKCLTGLAQMGITWLRLFEITKNEIYINEGLNIIAYLKGIQNIQIKNASIRGGIPGSYPIWGEYLPFAYPNWAEKFMMDLLLLNRSIQEGVDYTIHKG